MKPVKILSYTAIVLIGAISFILPASAQDSTSVKDTSIVIPFKDLPVSNIKATGNKKTGELVISMVFENKINDMVDASLSVGGWESFGFSNDKGQKYAVHTYYNKMTDDNPNVGYKRINNIQFGTKVFDIATILEQYLKAGEKATFTVRVPGYDKTSKLIKSFRVRCIYKQFGKGSIWGDKKYIINSIPIEWK